MNPPTPKLKEQSVGRNWLLRKGDWVDVLRTIPDESVNCCVTSPPYWGLRDYGVLGQLGLERTPEEYVSKVVEGFREVRRVLRKDGALWLNLGDSYATTPPGCKGVSQSSGLNGAQGDTTYRRTLEQSVGAKRNTIAPGLKAKDLVGIPWMVAFALRSDGWYLRQDIIWAKPNPMPESVTDRCTKAHEYLFLLSRESSYYCDMDAIKETRTSDHDAAEFRGGCYVQGEIDSGTMGKRTAFGDRKIKTPGVNSRLYQDRDPQHSSERKKIKVPGGWDRGEGGHGTIHRNGRTSAEYQDVEVSPYRNKRSVWEIATSPFPEAHFATFPPKLVEPCILAGCPEGGTVLDPFAGAGTTGLVAMRLNRNFIGIELNPEYVAMASRRIEQDSPLFNTCSPEAL